MTYFTKIKNLDELKKQYKVLARQHHPDLGGDVEVMKAINVEYDKLHDKYNVRATQEGYESAQQWRNGYYEQQGWVGENYDRNLYVKDIAVLIRAYVKKHFGYCKFSITSDVSSISVKMMEAPFDVFSADDDPRVIEEMRRKRLQGFLSADEHIMNNIRRTQSCSLSKHSIKEESRITPLAASIMHDIYIFMQTYNFDHSDIMTDYFHTNFYVTLGIGKLDKPFKVVHGKKIPDLTDLVAA